MTNNQIYLALAFMVGVTMVIATVVWFVFEANRQARIRERLDMYIIRKGDDNRDTSTFRAEIKKKTMDKRLKVLNEKTKYSRSRLGYVKARIVRAGLDIGVTQFWLVCTGIGLVFSLLWVISGKQPLITPLMFVFGTFILPRWYLNKKASKRQREFTKHFPNAIDILVRGLKSGMPVQASLRVISSESPEPVGSEFRTVVDQVNAGLPLPDALEKLFDRMPTQELRFFATVIAVQAQVGGNLAEILGNISRVLRSRAQLKEKAKALSGEARMSSVIVGALPFLVSGVLMVANRPYIELLWTTRVGYMFLGAACCMMFMGVFIMNKMGQLDI